MQTKFSTEFMSFNCCCGSSLLLFPLLSCKKQGSQKLNFSPPISLAKSSQTILIGHFPKYFDNGQTKITLMADNEDNSSLQKKKFHHIIVWYLKRILIVPKIFFILCAVQFLHKFISVKQWDSRQTDS